MAIVHIPRHMRDATEGEATIEVPGGQLGKVVESLFAVHPSLREVLHDEGRLRPDIAIAINSEITDNGLLIPVPEDAEVFLVPAIGGG